MAADGSKCHKGNKSGMKSGTKGWGTLLAQVGGRGSQGRWRLSCDRGDEKSHRTGSRDGVRRRE